MNSQQAYLPLALFFVAAFAGKTWYDAKFSENGTLTPIPPATIAHEQVPPSQSQAELEHHDPTSNFSVKAQPVKAQSAKQINSTSSSPTSPPHGEQEANEPNPRMNGPEQEDETLKDIINSLDDEFYSQVTDEHWALESGNQIYAYFEQMAHQENHFGSELRSIECRSSLCKVTVQHENMASAENFSLHFPMHVGTLLPTINYQFENLPDGKINVLMFLAAENNTAQ